VIEPVLSLYEVAIQSDHSRLLSHANLQLQPGEWLAITGPSGAGKSTLLAAIMGIHPLAAGRISLCGIPVEAPYRQQLRQQFGYLPQSLPENGMTVELFLQRPRSFAANQHSQWLPLPPIMLALGLDEALLSRRLKDLSGGQRQRVAAACCLQFQRPLMLADEPTSALDPASKQQLIDYLRSRDLALVSVSHDRDWIAACDRRVSFQQGRLQEESTR